jgi:hypothetical protein
VPLRFHWFLPTSGASRHVVPGAGGHAREASLDYRVQIAAVTLFAVNASPSPSSTTHALATAVIELAGEGTVVDLADYDAGALPGRHADPDVDALLASLAEASVLVLVTPVYRATYTGLLKVVIRSAVRIRPGPPPRRVP